jgi:acyl dehydratase
MSGAPRYWFDDFPVGRVREFGPVTVSREDILRFAREYDPQPFHVDEDAARRLPFGGIIASGWQTCALAMRMAVDGVFGETAALGSPGVERLDWLRPVRPGDELRLRLTTLEARPARSKPHVGLVKNRWEVLNQQGEEVLRMEAVTMILLWGRS